MATQNINIVISQTGGVTVIRTIQGIGQAAANAVNPLRMLQTQLNAVMGALAIGQLADWADEWTAAANKVAVFSKTQQETNEVLNQLYNIAQKVGQPLNGVVDLYHKLSIQAKSLGASVEDNIRVTEIVSKALTIQGTSAQAAHGALLQLGQAMGTGKIKAQEYNSLLTGLPIVLKIVADNLKEAGGSVTKLTALQRAGGLTSKMFYDALLKGGVDVDRMFGSQTRTFAQGMAVLTNGMAKYLGQLNQSLGLSRGFFQLTTLIANNLETIGKLLLVVGAGVAVAFAPAIVNAFATALGFVVTALLRISALLLANPFVLIATAVAAVIAFGDAWDAGIDGMTTVKDVFRALMAYIIEGFQAFQDWAKSAWAEVSKAASDVFNQISDGLGDSVGDWFKSFTTFFDDVGNGFIGVLRGIAKVMDAIAGLILGVVIGIGRVFGGLPEVVSQIFARVYNEIATWIEKAINVVISGINTVRETVGMSLLDMVTLDKQKIDTKVFEDYGQSIASSIDAGFEMQGGYMVQRINDLENRAKAFNVARQQEADKMKNRVNLGERGPAEENASTKKDKSAENALKRLQNELRTLLNRIDPASGALLEMAKAQKILTDAVKENLITEEQRQKYLPLLEQHYRDIISPLGKYVREIADELQLSTMNNREREVEAQLMKMKQDLMMKGQPMNAQQIADMREMLALQQKMNEEAAVRDNLQQGSAAEGMRGFKLQIKGIKDLMADPSSGFGKDDATNALASQMSELFAGTQELWDAQVAGYQDMYDKIDLMRQNDLISESTAIQMRRKVVAMESQQQLEVYTNFFSSLESLSTSSNKKLAAIGKAAAIANATIKGYEAVQVALASAPPPYNYALAAGVAVQAAANVAKILSTDTAFATGGSFTVGGSGGVDSQMVAFRASPGEQVNVSTPTQVRHGTAGQTQGGATAAEPTILKPTFVNVVDPSVMESYLTSPAGEKAIVNVIRNNPSVVRNAATGGRG